MSDDPTKRLTDLEDFLFGVAGQPQEEVVANLRNAGIDTDRAAKRIEMMVHQKREAHLRSREETSNDSIEPSWPYVEDVSAMPRELLLASYERFSDQSNGGDQDAAEMSDDELRSWLAAIADLENKKRDS